MLELWQALVLGIVQGLTEFLPVSSSGHLVVLQQWLQVPGQVSLSFDIVIHLGTLLAVGCYYQSMLRRLLAGIAQRQTAALRMAGLLMVGTIPALIVGVVAKDYLEAMFNSVRGTAWQLVANGFLLVIADRLTGRGRMDAIRHRDAWWIGWGQALAIIPGISRSGATIAVGLGRKLSRPAAANFSFLLAIPAILGAGVFDLPHLAAGGYRAIGPLAFWAGLISAAVTGFLVIKLFLRYLENGTLQGFGYYCLVLGGLLWVIAR